jgi:membrane protein
MAPGGVDQAMPRSRSGVRAAVRAVAEDVRGELRGRDLVLWAAGLTFFGVLAVVPLLLLGLWGAAALFGPALVVDGARLLGDSLPDAHDARPALDGLAAAAVAATWPVLLAALLPASLYGEGLRRGLTAVTGGPATGAIGWAGRLRFVPVLVAAPLLVAFPLAFAPVAAPLYAAGGWSAVLGVVLSFHLDLVPVCVAVGLVLAGTGPSVLPGRVVALAAFALGSVLTGFLHGFVLFLAIPVDWNLPFGGLPVVGAVVALALWLFGLHIVLLFGYRVVLSSYATWQRGHRDDTPGPPARPLAGGRAGAAGGPAGLDGAGTDVRGGETGGDRGGGEAGGGPAVRQLVRPGRERRDPR